MLEVARRLGPCCGRSPFISATFGLLLTVQAALTVQVAWAQSSLDRFYPPIVQRGIETMIAAEGKLDPWPQTIVCDRDNVTVVCDKEKGKFKVTVSKDSAPGIAWIRAYDKKSASSWVPLLIGTVAPTIEKEPNNKIADAKMLKLPSIVTGKLQKNGDIDSYRVSVKAKQRLIASVTANQVLGSPMDAVLQLTDLQGNVVLQSEDVRGVDPQIVFDPTADEELLLRIFSFPIVPTGSVRYAGSAAFVYTIDVTTGPFVDHTTPRESSVAAFGYNLTEKVTVAKAARTSISPATAWVDGALGWSWLADFDDGKRAIAKNDAEVITLPAVAFGHILVPKDVHKFRFTAKKNAKYRAEVHSKSHGYLLDSNLRIVDTKSGSELASNDDISRGQFDAGIDFTAKEDGKIEVQLSDLVEGFGLRHAYELHIHKATQSCWPTVSPSQHVIEGKDGTLEITIILNRQQGFNEKVSFAATGLPDGVTAKPVVSESKGKSVKLKLNAKQAAATSKNFQIVGTVLDKNAKPTDEKVNAVFELRPAVQLKQLWLTVK